MYVDFYPQKATLNITTYVRKRVKGNIRFILRSVYYSRFISIN